METTGLLVHVPDVPHGRFILSGAVVRVSIVVAVVVVVIAVATTVPEVPLIGTAEVVCRFVAAVVHGGSRTLMSCVGILAVVPVGDGVVSARAVVSVARSAHFVRVNRRGEK